MVICEVLNMLNVILQIYCTHRFLGRQFLMLGVNFLRDDFTGRMDALDIVFPKVTKCHFYKFGASGSIQKHDALCVMALNVINEKIFTFLWFWYIIVGFVSIWALLWRLLTMTCHSKSSKFNGFVFSFASPGRLNPYDMEVVIKHLQFTDWLFLYYIAKNIHSFMFRDLLKQLANEINQQTRDENEENEMRKMNSIQSLSESFGYAEDNELDEQSKMPSVEEQRFIGDTVDLNHRKKTVLSSDF
jgi:innexin